MVEKQQESEGLVARNDDVLGGNRDHGDGQGQSQMKDLGMGMLFGWSVSPEEACWC